MTKVQWIRASATSIGTSHLKNGSECQDFHRTFQVETPHRNFLVLIGSDGAGSYDYGKKGSVLVCHVLGSLARKYLKEYCKHPDENIVTSWFQYLQMVLLNVADVHSSEIKQFSATALLAIYDGKSLFTAHVGDGAIVYRNSNDEWKTISPPENGEYASTTFFVSDTKNLSLRFNQSKTAATCISLFTDGIESLVIDQSTNLPHDGFLEPFYNTLLKSKILTGRDANFSNQLKVFLSSDRLNSRTDDDKTFVLALRLK